MLLLLSKENVERLIYAVNGALESEFKSPLTPYGEDLFADLKSNLEKAHKTALPEFHWVFYVIYKIQQFWYNKRFAKDANRTA